MVQVVGNVYSEGIMELNDRLSTYMEEGKGL